LKRYDYNGKVYSRSGLCRILAKETELEFECLVSRLRRGWTIEEAKKVR